MHFEFTIPLEPVAKGRPRFSKLGRAFTPSKTRKAEQDIRYFLSREFSRPPLEGPIHLFARFTFERPKSVPEHKRPFHTVSPDWDNVAKAVTDAANGILFCDDRQIVFATIEKAYGPKPSIYLHVKEVGNGDT
jgi:Holliday junction resolvase RusA-like endonuclease